jgi:hypothetical protein
MVHGLQMLMHGGITVSSLLGRGLLLLITCQTQHEPVKFHFMPPAYEKHYAYQTDQFEI